MSTSRRRFLGALLGAGAASALSLAGSRPARSGAKPAKHLIVVTGFGGASIIDSFLPIAASESQNAATLDTYLDADIVTVPGSPIRTHSFKGTVLSSPAPGDLPQFLAAHRHDMMITTSTVSSVNHAVAQKRSMNGGGAMHGRTLTECVALEYGAGYPLPNVNMGSLGFLESGSDPSLPSFARQEPVNAPLKLALGLDGRRGIQGVPSDASLELARAVRRDRLDPESAFYKTFRKSDRLTRYLAQRDTDLPTVEQADLVTQLNLLGPDDGPDGSPLDLAAFGLASSPDHDLLRTVFPAMSTDPLEAQAALAYLLIKNRVSVAVTLGPNFNLTLGETTLIANPPLSFDRSHQEHRATQSFMWGRLTSIIDRLIGLLKNAEFDATTGESFWDRTMIHVATDFGRSKNRPTNAPDYSSGHDLNNGNLTLAPFVKGNTVLGGVNFDTARTYGFDTATGAPLTGKEMQEGEIFMGLLGALEVPIAGGAFPDVPAMRK